MFYIVDEQIQQQQNLQAQAIQSTAETPTQRRCRKCKNPMRGHSRKGCPGS